MFIFWHNVRIWALWMKIIHHIGKIIPFFEYGYGMGKCHEYGKVVFPDFSSSNLIMAS